MLKILIVADSVTPDFSPRVSFLARNLVGMGHSVSVLAEDVENPLYVIDAPGVNIVRTKFYKTKSNSFFRKIEWCTKSLLNLCFDYKSWYFSRKWSKAIAGKEFDVVICSTFNYFPLKPAYKIAEQFSLPLITDIRDLAEQFTKCEYQLHSIPFFSGLYDKSQRYRRDVYISKAAHVITVSPWHKEFLSRRNSNVSLIYNGFDSSMFFYKELKSSKFEILYTGKWLGLKMQDPTLLFEAIEKLVSLGRLDVNDVKLKWVLSKGREEMGELLGLYPVCSKVSEFANRVQYSEIPALLNSASIILVLSNVCSSNGPKGIMTTKFFEALGCEKPVLNVKADGQSLSEVICRTDAGVSAIDVESVMKFIEEKYAEWKSFGFTHQRVNASERLLYDRKEQAKQFEKIFLLFSLK